MAGFLTPLRVERINGGNKWRVLEPFEYCAGAANSDVKVIVPIGFTTDFASIPRGLWNLFPPVGGKYDKAAVLHDWLYQNPVLFNYSYSYTDPALGPDSIDLNRKECDAIFNEAMQVMEVGTWTRRLVWSGVRVGGWKPWNKYRSKESE